MKKSFVLLLASLAGITLSKEDKEIADDKFEADFDAENFMEQIQAKETEIQALFDKANSVGAKDTKITELTDENKELKKFKTDNETSLGELPTVRALTTELRNEVIRKHTAIHGSAPDAAMTTVLGEASLAVLKSFDKTYSTQLEDKFPNTCKDCGSKNVGRNSASADNEETDDKGGKGKNENNGGKTTQQLLDEIERDNHRDLTGQAMGIHTKPTKPTTAA